MPVQLNAKKTLKENPKLHIECVKQARTFMF